MPGGGMISPHGLSRILRRVICAVKLWALSAVPTEAGPAPGSLAPVDVTDNAPAIS
jgi:hypothetical protein